MISYMISFTYMKNKLDYSFDNYLKEQLKSPAFRTAWKESETEYSLAKQLIEKRLKKQLSQRELAKRAKTTQAVISRIETMQSNPSLATLRRIAGVLGARVTVSII